MAHRNGRPRLDAYVRHAERYGTSFVYETAAADGFRAVELGQLARHLRRVDRRWRLAQADRRALAERLVADGVKAKDVVEMADVSHTVVAAIRAAGSPGLGDPTPANRMVKRRKVPDSGVSAPEPGLADPVAQLALFTDRAEAPAGNPDRACDAGEEQEA
jgi:hypothetical protein